MHCFFSSRVLALAALAALAGCAGGAATPPAALVRDGTWMSPSAASSDLLYVSDITTNTVHVFSYPAGKPRGSLGGFTNVHGVCADAAGHVFVTDSLKTQIRVYAHGGTQPIRTLYDPGYFPNSCAVDPVTGDLAVANFGPMGSGPGGVSIYRHARGKPVRYFANPNGLYHYYYCTYDDKGNLYVDGNDREGPTFEFAKLPAGSTTFKDVTLDQHIYRPGGVQWDGANVAIGDQSELSGPSPVYTFAVRGSKGTLVHAIALTDSCDLLEFTISNGRIIGANDCGSSVKVWNYPGGGASLQSFDRVKQPVGVALSLGSQSASH